MYIDTRCFSILLALGSTLTVLFGSSFRDTAFRDSALNEEHKPWKTWGDYIPSTLRETYRKTGFPFF